MDIEKYNRNKKLIYLAIGIMLIGVLVFVIIGFALFYEPERVVVIPTPTLTPTTLEPTSIVPTIITNNESKLYYISSDSFDDPGILMRYDPLTKANEEVDKISQYKDIIDINLSNTYLGFLNSDQKLNFYDIKNGSTLDTNYDIGSYGYFFDDTTFALVSDQVVTLISLPDLKISDTIDIILPAESTIFGISPDLEYLLAKETEGFKRSYILEIDEKTVKYLERYDLEDEIAFNYLSFLPLHDVMYFNSIGISILYPSDMTTKRLFSFNINMDTASELTPLILSSSGSNYYYFYQTKLYRFSNDNFVNRQLLDLVDLNILEFNGFEISPDEAYIAMDRVDNSSVIIDLDTLRSTALCDFSCFDPYWEN